MMICTAIGYIQGGIPVEELKRSLYFLIFSLAFLIPLIWFVSRKQIILYKNSFSYSTGSKTQYVIYETITGSDIRFKLKNKYPDIFWDFETKDDKFHSFQISLYSRKDLQTFAGKLLTESGKASHSGIVHELAEGKFPWYIR